MDLFESRKKSNSFLRPFKKGQSGNPGGISKTVKQVRDMLKTMHPDCEKVLKGILDNWEEDRKSALKAVEIIYSRTLGKEQEPEKLWAKKAPTESLGPDLKTLPDEALDKIQAIVREHSS